MILVLTHAEKARIRIRAFFCNSMIKKNLKKTSIDKRSDSFNKKKLLLLFRQADM